MVTRRVSTRARARQVNFRLPGEIWQRLDATAGLLGLPQSRIVTDALVQYFQQLPAETRSLIDKTIALRQKH
jgi:predicted DNA-binding protein